jgi:disulfide bond formation protein DsbB
MAHSSETGLFRNLNALGILAICAVLLVALYSQFVDGELPCPLCLLQRVACVAVLTGLVLNVVKGPKPDHYSIMIISAFFGAAVSLRQIALHIVPGSGSYGAPFLGLHYYTWSFIVFALVILGTAIIAAYSTQYHKQRFIRLGDQGALAKLALVTALVVVAANAIATFAECGPWQCPDNPVSYWLFD